MSKTAIESLYKKRIVDSVIESYLKISGAVCMNNDRLLGEILRDGIKIYG